MYDTNHELSHQQQLYYVPRLPKGWQDHIWMHASWSVVPYRFGIQVWLLQGDGSYHQALSNLGG